MSYRYNGKDKQERYIPADHEEVKAKFARYRDAESQINGGPAPVYIEPAPMPVRPRRKEAECGTHGGYKRHRKDGPVTCRSCLDARAIYQRDYRARRAIHGPIARPYGSRPGPAPKPLGEFDSTLCGTLKGWRQHRSHKQEKCEGCKDVYNEYHAGYRARRNAH